MVGRITIFRNGFKFVLVKLSDLKISVHKLCQRGPIWRLKHRIWPEWNITTQYSGPVWGEYTECTGFLFFVLKLPKYRINWQRRQRCRHFGGWRWKFFLKISFFIFRPTSAWLWIKSYKKRPKKFNRRLHYDFKMAAILDFCNVRRLSVVEKFQVNAVFAACSG